MCDLVFLEDDEKLSIPSMMDKTFEELVEMFPYYPEMCSYKVRVDIHQPQFGDVTVKQCIEVLKDSEIYMYAVEKLGTENPHFQALVVTSVRRDTIVARLKKLGLHSSGFACTKSKEQWPIEYLAYLLKEGNPEYHNFPEEVRLAVVKRQDFVRRTYLDKKAEKTRTSVWEKIAQSIPADFDYYDPEAEFKLVKLIIKYQKEHKRVISHSQLLAYCDTILLNKCESRENSYIYNVVLKNR